MNRRDFLRLLSAGVIGYELDVDKLLWVPDQKTIFLPSSKQLLFYQDIINIETARMLPGIIKQFDRDDIFYQTMSKNDQSIHIDNISKEST